MSTSESPLELPGRGEPGTGRSRKKLPKGSGQPRGMSGNQGLMAPQRVSGPEYVILGISNSSGE